MLSRDAKVELLPDACLTLARAGHDLYEALFPPKAGQNQDPNEIRGWLEDLRDQHLVESLEVLLAEKDGNRIRATPRAVPWNVFYDEPPDAALFRAPGAHPALWQPFWGVRYNLAMGRKVDPRRRLSFGDKKLHVVFVVDPQVLPTEEWSNLQAFAERQGYPILHSREELENYRADQPVDLLYWLGHADASALVLGGAKIDAVELFRVCQRLFHRQARGLVVLNACQTAEEGREGSFMEALHDAGLSGMVATEERTVNIFANRFGLAFLQAFLVEGEAIGLALQTLRAGGHALAPLGLLYGTYCPPDIRARRPTAVSAPVPITQQATDPPPGAISGAFLGLQAQPGPPPPLPEHPYRSLAYYEREHRALFAGRDADVERFALVLDQADCRLAVLHGQSGVGKSSFLRAGLLPFLEEECIGYQFLRDRQAGRNEPILFIRATNDPTGPLAKALCDFGARTEKYVTPIAGKAPVEVDLPGILRRFLPGVPSLAALGDAMRADTSLLGRLLAALAERLPYTLVLVIDQGEEVFTLARTQEDEGNRHRALEMLRRVLEVPGRFKVIVSLRTEYYGRLVDALRQDVGSATVITDYLLTDLQEREMADAILRPTATAPIPHAREVPAEKYRFRYESGVAETITREVRDYCRGKQDSELPLAQIICTQLYERARLRSEAVISRQDFGQIGGVQGGLRKHVETLLADLLPHPRDRKAFRRLFCRLYRRQPDGLVTTELVVEEELARQWTGHISFDAMLEMTSRNDRNLLRVKSLPGKQGERRYVSLGHDALATVAQKWAEQYAAKKRVGTWAIAVVCSTSLALVMAVLALVAWSANNKANDLRSDAENREKELEGALAQTSLRPLSQTIGPLNDAEIEAFIQLARWRDTPIEERFADRFLQEALNKSSGRRRLGVRGTYALHALVGLSREKRDRVEKELMEKLRDADLPENDRIELAFALVALGGLSPGSAAETAQLLMQAGKAPNTDTNRFSLPSELAALAARMEPQQAAETATLLVQAMKESKTDAGRLSALASALAAMAGRMEPQQASKTCADAAALLVQAMKESNNDPYRFDYLPSALAALAARMEPQQAAETATLLVQAMKESKTDAGRLSALASALAAMAGRMEPQQASKTCADAAALLVQAMKESNNDPYRFDYLPSALAALATRMEPQEASNTCADAATLLVQAMKDTRNDPGRLGSLAGGLEALAAQMEPQQASKACADAATLLVQAMKDPKADSGALDVLAFGLAALAGRMEPQQASKACADATLLLLQAMKDIKRDPNRFDSATGGLAALAALAVRMEPQQATESATLLVQAMKDPKTDLSGLRNLASGLPALAARMEPQQAAETATLLVQAMKESKTGAERLSALASGLAALAARMESQQAAETATLLIQAMKESKTDAGRLSALASALAAMAGRMEPQQASKTCADAALLLVQAMKDSTDGSDAYILGYPPFWLPGLAAQMEPNQAAETAAELVLAIKDPKTDADRLGSLASGLAALLARMQPEQARKLCAAAGPRLVRAIKDPNNASFRVLSVAFGLEALTEWMDPQQASDRSRLGFEAYLSVKSKSNGYDENLRLADMRLFGGFRSLQNGGVPATAIAAIGDGRGLPLALAVLSLQAKAPRCHLTSQDLVDVLKHPLCVGEVQRMVLGQLENLYQWPFADVWEFVRYAEQQHLMLNLK